MLATFSWLQQPSFPTFKSCNSKIRHNNNSVSTSRQAFLHSSCSFISCHYILKTYFVMWSAFKVFTENVTNIYTTMYTCMYIFMVMLLVQNFTRNFMILCSCMKLSLSCCEADKGFIIYHIFHMYFIKFHIRFKTALIKHCNMHIITVLTSEFLIEQ